MLPYGIIISQCLHIHEWTVTVDMQNDLTWR